MVQIELEGVWSRSLIPTVFTIVVVDSESFINITIDIASFAMINALARRQSLVTPLTTDPVELDKTIWGCAFAMNPESKRFCILYWMLIGILFIVSMNVSLSCWSYFISMHCLICWSNEVSCSRLSCRRPPSIATTEIVNGLGESPHGPQSP